MRTLQAWQATVVPAFESKVVPAHGRTLVQEYLSEVVQQHDDEEVLTLYPDVGTLVRDFELYVQNMG